MVCPSMPVMVSAATSVLTIATSAAWTAASKTAQIRPWRARGEHNDDRAMLNASGARSVEGREQRLLAANGVVSPSRPRAGSSETRSATPSRTLIFDGPRASSFQHLIDSPDWNRRAPKRRRRTSTDLLKVGRGHRQAEDVCRGLRRICSHRRLTAQSSTIEQFWINLDMEEKGQIQIAGE